MNAESANINVSKVLADFIANARFEHLNDTAVQMTRVALLDALGVSIAATQLGEGVSTFVDWVKEQQAPGPCKIFAHDVSTSASLAAFANGAFAHALDFEDAHDTALVHPNAAVIPAVIAVAQTNSQLTLADVITAIAVGCEVTCRLGLAVGGLLDRFSWYPPPILSAYGATAAVAKLLDLKPQQILDAFSLVLSQATCSAEIKHNSHSQIRAIRDAFPAQTGVVSAQLAKKGLSGFSQPLDGQDGFFAGFARGEYNQQALLNNLGNAYAISELSFKPWPSCRGTHTPIELTLNLCKSHQLTPKEINTITVFSNGLNRMLAEPIDSKQKPSTAIDAKFSIPFCVASAVVNGHVDLDSFAPAALSNPVVLTMAKKVSYQVDKDFTSPLSARVEIELVTGTALVANATSALGCPERPMGESALVEKFKHCLSYSLDKKHHHNAQAFANALLNMAATQPAAPLFKYL